MLTHQPLFAAGAMLALAVTVEMTLPAERPTESARDCIAQKWVDDNVGRLPTTYEAFASYPVAYRNMIYARLPLDTRVEFWRVHLERFMSTHDLSLAQAELVQTIHASLPVYLEVNSPVKIDSLYVRAVSVLGVELVKDAFLNLVPLSANMGEACSCSTVHGGCEGFYACGVDEDSCDAVACGWLGHDTCNGECLSPGG